MSNDRTNGQQSQSMELDSHQDTPSNDEHVFNDSEYEKQIQKAKELSLESFHHLCNSSSTNASHHQRNEAIK
eukprot:CAMPEP_0201595290 /NCGR_PEP_ID=MMETSP0190_2-20130828/192340_1 /ASSEMBLY_ACC=CAM_ASM_000263 /TAXON_ID=37353 /ORGANISM="Rosalina sp." /LENGTH=71 /DNA_ID=CAMNT_0048055221 /DNA_START=206 /DNA_END=424 /DNA_ORIENTATION=+